MFLLKCVSAKTVPTPSSCIRHHDSKVLWGWRQRPWCGRSTAAAAPNIRFATRYVRGVPPPPPPSLGSFLLGMLSRISSHAFTVGASTLVFVQLNIKAL